MSRIIISGSAGFLGKHLVKRLKKNNHTIIGWDVQEGNDVCNPNLKEGNISAIFHLACPVNPGNYKAVALPTLLASSVGTYNMLELARKNHAKFLYVSSSEVYGDSASLPFKESDPGIVNTSDPRSYYAESKRFGEMATMVYYYYFGLDVRILRPFNIYGPGMRENDSRVIPSFMRAKRDEYPLVLNDSGKTVRTFCYVDDFIEGVMRAMYYPNTNGEIFNLGSEDKISMYDLAKMIDGEVKVTNYIREGEQKIRQPDISKAEKMLSWKPEISLKKGLELMWKSYQ